MVAQNGLDALTFLVERMGSDFRPYLTIVLPPIIDRLGDSKDLVREKAQVLITRMMDSAVPPQQMFDRLAPAFSHKNGKIREELMECLQRTLKDHGAQSLSVSRLVPSVAKLMSDPIATVRDTAFNTLTEIYRHHLIGMTRHFLLPAVMNRFDEIRASGDMMPNALTDGEY
ncbi:UNVERIFIED_CONTAM: hypothetical protein B566_EDAN017943 [Ephemera danica]|nr:hypothetical protein B566_EDAN017943 [Ephemera danica]